MSRIRILCVDDHLLVREGISIVIDREPDMEVVASVASGEEALKVHDSIRPDITLMDLQLGGMSGIETIRQLAMRPSLSGQIIVLTVLQGDEDIYRALEAGAVTYLLKDTLSQDLVRVIREVHSGQRPLHPSVSARLAERAAGQPLTERETQIVELLSHGLRNKEIGAALGITERTTEVHVRNILAKLNVKDRTAALTVAIRRGIIHLK